jgi:midasin
MSPLVKTIDMLETSSIPEASQSSFNLTEECLCPAVTIVGTTPIYKPISAKPSTRSQNFLHVSTPSNIATIDQISYCLQRRLPVLLSSLTSAGKTHTIHYMASRIYPSETTTNRVLTIAAADTSLDAKSLLGSYVSSPSQPGTFTWTEGALTKAVRSGRWVVVEDLDRASQEVLSLVATLADGMGPAKMAGSRVKLNIPGRDSVEAGLGFALFGTRTVNNANEAAKATFLGHNYFASVYLPAPNGLEIVQMLDARFPTLSQSAASKLIDIYLSLSNQMSNLHGRNRGRSYGLRDLEKWCARVERILPEATPAHRNSSAFVNPVVQDEVFMEALDIFTAAFDSASSPALRQRQEDIAALIATSLDIGDERRDFLLRKRVPQLEIIGDSRARASKEIRIGRASLTGLPKDPTRLKDTGRPYALTRPSLVLLERLAAGIDMSEPVLLVGETGTGKTTAVQYFADVLNRPLTVLNMSTQTETGDLLGGFKPIDAALPGRELHGRWLSLFRRTFSKNRNEKYESGVRKAINAGNWRRVADMWIGAADLARDRLRKAKSK